MNFLIIYMVISFIILLAIGMYEMYCNSVLFDAAIWGFLWIIALPLHIYYYYIRLYAKKKLKRYTGRDWISAGMAMRMGYKKPSIVSYTQIAFTRGKKLEKEFNKLGRVSR